MELIPVVTESGVDELIPLVQHIWREHFTAVIGEKQVEYMLNNYQSKEQITHQISFEQYTYYIILLNGKSVGYTAYYIKSEGLFLSKLYLKKETRGRGIAREILSHLENIAKINKLKRIELQCNRDNLATLEVYKHLGFQIIEEKKVDIGNGFFMDDYYMEKIVKL